MENKNNFSKLVIGALGIVFGDIGTSPIYTLKECLNPIFGIALTQENIIGILSVLFWSLIVVVILKYTIFIMRADNKGEGGVMSLCSLIISNMQSGRTLMLITSVGLIGTSLLFADGMITPAITVLSAIEGLSIATPVFKPFILPFTIIVLIVLFLSQKHGTEKIGKIFGPVMILWFSSLALLGINSIIKAPVVFAALNPLNAVGFFSRNGLMSFFILSAIVLAITGVEALFADMGHFGKKPIRLAFYFFVLPSLTLNYFGQGASVIIHGTKALENPFYFICPPWFIYPLIIIATLAAIVASQAMISGAFSVFQQAMQLGYAPKLRVVHTSEDMHGQIYIPFISNFLMVSCIFLVLTFRSSGNLASAYGMAVMGTMLCTTILFSIVIRKIWKWKRRFTIPLLLLFLTVDLSFLGANLSKLMSGGWLPLAVAVTIFIIMLTWKDGTQAVYEYINKENIPLDNIINDLKSGHSQISRVSGNAIFMLGRRTNLNVLLHHLKHNKVLHKKVFLMTVKFERVPFIDVKNRVSIESLGAEIYGIDVKYGYMENPDINEIFQICTENGHKLNANQVSFYLGRINLGIEKNHRMSFWRKKLYIFLHRNSESAVEYFRLNPGTVIELGRKITI